MRPSRSSSTCAAVVGLVWPKRLALGAAMGMPAAAMRGQCGWVRWLADAYERACCGDLVWDSGGAFEQQGERTGPERLDEALGAGRDDGDLFQHRRVGDVDDERVPGGALLGGEDFGYCDGRQSVSAETVDGFGGEGYRAAVAEDFRRFRRCLWGRGVSCAGLRS